MVHGGFVGRILATRPRRIAALRTAGGRSLPGPDRPRGLFPPTCPRLCEIRVRKQNPSALRGGTALVFFRHLYYLRVSYAYGDPVASWLVDRDRLRTTAEWQEFLRREHIRWIVRAAEFPPTIATPLPELEATGMLTPYASGRVDDIQGMRMQGARSEVQVMILRVAD